MPSGVYKNRKNVGYWLGKKRPHLSYQAKKKLSLFWRGKKKPPFTEEHRKKIGENSRKRIGQLHPQWKGGKERFKCIDCKIIIANAYAKRCRRCDSELRKGEKCNFWKGGVTPVNHRIRTSREYRLWREAVFKRDNWTCVWCGARGKINADHIKPFAYFPEFRFAIDNGRTLCIECHRKTDTWGNRALVNNYKVERKKTGENINRINY